MAQLSITVGTLTSTVSTSNAKAQNLLDAYSEAIGATGTNQAKADAVVQSLVRHMKEQAQRHRAVSVQGEATVAAQAEIDAIGWE